MNEKQILELINKGEGINIEFKESKTKLNKDVFESVCAFLNRNGGHLFLGVKDDGTIVGIDDDSVKKVKDNFVSSMNNPDKINPTCYSEIQEIKTKGKTILYVSIPESSDVHRCNGKIYDRNEDGDFNITSNRDLVFKLYMRKQSTYSENTIYPAVKMSQLREDIFEKVRRFASNRVSNHPWKSMGNMELLKSAGLYLEEPQSGKEGITLAGILIFGTDILIHAALPHYKTDAIKRVQNLDRYDDRDYVDTNLIDSYDRLMQFIAKHLNDKFYLEGDIRTNIRDMIFREVISNILVHREYLDPFPAKLIIEKNRVYAENGNTARGSGEIDPKSFSPYSKNPTIAKFFREIGWVDELGSGVRNINKYNKIYSGSEAQFIEGDVFKTIIPLDTRDTRKVNDPVEDEKDRETKDILEFCKIPRSREEIQQFVGIKSTSHFRRKVLNPLIKGGLLNLILPDKPTSPNQKYYS
ncbi:RNA-binding domain-containing protein [Tissierella creatinophila]|uniref:Divergent AAA domain protein n=1 Tax=Tissierella creatinophila DSM 6911 TaxID=1123403 RepID=A0A1U7M5L6_TISCR|nr:RNA-binding domain-containing protein [Tissierella creatinophila]OLS02550.1 divergent AAA domain protein [Tissierella creatinophila DSM 6911]